jgi:hypothetical protein
MKTSRHANREYFTTLTNHKEIIKTNKYARELEQRYHKIHHQSFKAPIPLTSSLATAKNPVWPIDSQAFNNILRSKLHDAPNHVYLKPKAHLRIMSEFSRDSRHASREGSDLPDIYKGRFWSPPKLDQNFELLSTSNNIKTFGPKIRKVW